MKELDFSQAVVLNPTQTPPPNETKSAKIKKMIKFFKNDKKKKKRFML